VGLGIADAFSSQASKVLPAGSPEALRRIRIVAWSRPATSSASSTPEHFCVFPALGVGGRDHLGRGSADVWQPHASEQPVELLRQGGRGGRFDRHHRPPIIVAGRRPGQGIGRGSCSQRLRTAVRASVSAGWGEIGGLIARIRPMCGSSPAATSPQKPATAARSLSLTAAGGGGSPPGRHRRTGRPQRKSRAPGRPARVRGAWPGRSPPPSCA